MRSRVHRFFFWILVGVPLAIACGQEAVSIPDPQLPDSSTRGEGGNDGSVTDGGTTDGGADAADVACAVVLPDDATGVYVTPTGANTATCGTRAAPCKTIGFAVSRAVVALRSKVYASRGTYTEKVTLAAGVEVVGGWDIVSAKWSRACVNPEEAVVVRAPAQTGITVEARDLGGEARLSLLRIESATIPVAPGESVYGVVAVGATTTLVLSNVDIEIGSAPNGADGRKGDAGVDGAPSCPAGGGTPGTAGIPGTGAPAGTFDPATEYTPGTATPGGPATAGSDGLASGAGTCVTCGKCGAVLCDFQADLGPQACGKDGTSGCGGGPGAPGAAAGGGGSSIGVFAWDANVTVNGGKIKSGDAGNGGAGGGGGNGGAATRGAMGSPSDICVVGCQMVGAACLDMKGRGAAGAAGGNGGTGGIGGPGGGGSGGSSFAIYQGGMGVVTTAGSFSLAHGKAGKGGGPLAAPGAVGAAADRLP